MGFVVTKKRSVVKMSPPVALAGSKSEAQVGQLDQMKTFFQKEQDAKLIVLTD